MKILHIIESFGPGGKERRLLELIKGFRDDPEVDFSVIVLSDNIHYKELFDLGVEITIIQRKELGNIRTFYRVYKYCREHKPDIIHSWAGFISLYAGIISKLLNIKLINAMLTSASKVSFPAKKWLYSRTSYFFSDIILGNSKASLKAFKPPKRKSTHIYNGFNFNRLNDLEDINTVKERIEAGNDITVCMVATFSPNKDHETYLAAAENVTKQRDDVTFFCVGEGVLYEEYYRRYSENKKIRFLGNQSDVESIVNAIDIGVLSTKCESLPNSVMEYMALSKPTVATDVGGLPELVDNGKTGLLYEHRNINDLTEKIIKLIDHPELRKELGKEARARIEKVFSLENIISKTRKVYKELLN